MTKGQIYRRELLKQYYISFPLLFIAIIGVLLVSIGELIQKPFDRLQKKIEFGLIIDEALRQIEE